MAVEPATGAGMTRHWIWPALASAALLVACKPAVRETTPDQLACATPDAVSRVTFRFVMDHLPDEPLPPGAELLNDLGGERFVVRRRVVISGRNITGARLIVTEQGPGILIAFNKVGASELARATSGSGVYPRLAMVVDGVVITAPTITGPLVTNVIQVSGSFTEREASELAKRIETAALGCVPPPAAPPPAP